IDAFVPVFGEQVDPGDMRAHIEAILAGMRRDGRLPVCGRDIQPVFREYIVPNEASSRSVCTGFIDEDQVFAVVALFSFGAQDCVAIEKKTPLFDLFASEENLARTPYLFGMSAPPEVAWRSVAHWLVETGVVKGKKIGVYHSTESDVVPDNLIATLKKLGHPVDVVVTTDTPGGSTVADPNDGVAIQRFKAEGVTLAIPADGGGNFYRQAETQDYHPQWAVQGVAQASDATTGNYPPDIFDGALALLFEHVGEEKAGIPMSAEEQVCYRYWEEASGERPGEQWKRDWGKGQTIRESCDQINLFTLALARVGNNPLTRDTFVLGVETIRDVPLAYYGDAVVTPDKHYMTSKNVQQRYFKKCACWHSSNKWVPLYAQ
ncbi:MAG: ABC transporter substrate-binding protein, partial [Actinomycetota bacterium]